MKIVPGIIVWIARFGQNWPALPRPADCREHVGAPTFCKALDDFHMIAAESVVWKLRLLREKKIWSRQVHVRACQLFLAL